MLKKYLTVFFVSMIPLIELRGAIPYGVIFGLDVYKRQPVHLHRFYRHADRL